MMTTTTIINNNLVVNNTLDEVRNKLISKCNFLKIKNKKYVVISPDFDGLASFLLFKRFINPDVEVVGTYNTEFLFLNKDISFKEMFLLDGNIDLMDSIDHHIISKNFISDNSIYINPNLVSNNTKQIKKCPYNTEILLATFSSDLFNEILSAMERKDNKFLSFLLYGDSFIKIARKYQANVLAWLKKDYLESLYEYIQDNYDDLISECKACEAHLKSIGFRSAVYNFNFMPFSQTQNNLSSDASKISYFLNDFGRILKLKNIKVEPFTHYLKFDRSFFDKSQIDNIKVNIISHAIKNDSGKICISYQSNVNNYYKICK